MKLLKQEDSGDLYFNEGDLLAPDYRLTMNDGSQFFVEVKNCHTRNANTKFIVKKAYCRKLQHYSQINKLELAFAVYFSSWNHWVLLPISSMEESDEEYSIDFATAVAKSEMLKLGDCMIGTTPNLELHILTHPEEASVIDNSGKALFVTREIKLFCAGNEINDEIEKNIAFSLIRFGEWNETENNAIIKDNKLFGIKFTYSPREQTEPNFAIIGYLSSVISNHFKELTIKDGEVFSLNPNIDPAAFKVLIPKNYRGINLPLWRFEIHANPEFIGN